MLRPDADLLLTVHGAATYSMVKDTISKKQKEDFDFTGYLFLENISDKVLPDWFQNAIYNEHFGRLVFSAGFSSLRYDINGATGNQDSIDFAKSNTNPHLVPMHAIFRNHVR